MQSLSMKDLGFSPDNLDDPLSYLLDKPASTRLLQHLPCQSDQQVQLWLGRLHYLHKPVPQRMIKPKHQQQQTFDVCNRDSSCAL